MGKPTGFMEYDRCEAASVEPKERIKNFNEFHVFLSKENQQVSGSLPFDRFGGERDFPFFIPLPPYDFFILRRL